MTQELTVGKKVFYPHCNLCSYCATVEGPIRPTFYFKILRVRRDYTTIQCPKCKQKLEYCSDFLRLDCTTSGKITISI